LVYPPCTHSRHGGLSGAGVGRANCVRAAADGCRSPLNRRLMRDAECAGRFSVSSFVSNRGPRACRWPPQRGRDSGSRIRRSRGRPVLSLRASLNTVACLFGGVGRGPPGEVFENELSSIPRPCVRAAAPGCEAARRVARVSKITHGSRAFSSSQAGPTDVLTCRLREKRGRVGASRGRSWQQATARTERHPAAAARAGQVRERVFGDRKLARRKLLHTPYAARTSRVSSVGRGRGPNDASLVANFQGNGSQATAAGPGTRHRNPRRENLDVGSTAARRVAGARGTATTVPQGIRQSVASISPRQMRLAAARMVGARGRDLQKPNASERREGDGDRTRTRDRPGQPATALARATRVAESGQDDGPGGPAQKKHAAKGIPLCGPPKRPNHLHVASRAWPRSTAGRDPRGTVPSTRTAGSTAAALREDRPARP